MFKPAVITPYYNEDIETLDRCHRSCQSQTIQARHFLVADGKPRQELANWDVEHIILPHQHNDYGNTPRCIGALSAINLGHSPIFFLDADNWYSTGHIETAIKLKHAHPESDVIASRRHFVLPNGTIVAPDDEDLAKTHIDTSCMAFFESSYFLLPLWGTMTKPLSVIGDRIIYMAIKKHGLRISWSEEQTVYYTTNYRHHYLRAGQTPPEKTYSLDMSELKSFDSVTLFKRSRLQIDIKS
jgi:hypothetical protein